MRLEQITVTTNAGGSASGASSRPLHGYVNMIRLPNAGTALGGTADWTFTRRDDGGTILALTDGVAPWQYQPRDPVHTLTGGTTAYSVGGQSGYNEDGPPIDGYLEWTVAQATASATATVYVYVCD